MWVAVMTFQFQQVLFPDLRLAWLLFLFSIFLSFRMVEGVVMHLQCTVSGAQVRLLGRIRKFTTQAWKFYKLISITTFKTKIQPSPSVSWWRGDLQLAESLQQASFHLKQKYKYKHLSFAVLTINHHKIINISITEQSWMYQ